MIPQAGCGAECTFAVADAMPPLAKLVFGGMLGALMWLSRRRRPATRSGLVLRDAASGAVAAITVSAALPGGFGLIYVDGATTPLAIHVTTAALGGVLGTMLEASCRRRLGV